ncbi:phosphoserine phosphatase SerB [Pelagibaculum spongiae]|uniref:Phosphoserine phosphatase n=1 Tax=Pelagibaculum spongiae TaxID=2080658 RepID=A0A2V1GRF6_9GAMM|nr:phosphoserine phosphatase SerB [Pelagibaculum spongiae]PVZ66353.1 phosphoserine phosphatase SerB [Pelagibaculum spongiae]
MSEIVLVNISGIDKPGLTAQMMNILADWEVEILDIGQAVIHDTLSFGVMVHIPDPVEPVQKDLLYHLHSLNMQIRFTQISRPDYMQWAAGKGQQRQVITLLGREINAAQLAWVSRVISEQGLNIDDIRRLSGRPQLTQAGLEPIKQTVSIELNVRGLPQDVQLMQQQFLEISGETGMDIAFQHDNIYRRHRRLVCFDMDSTLIQTEVIDELAEEAGIGEQCKAITESAMRGELDFTESFAKRLSLLKGLDESVLQKVADRLPITEGAEKLLSTLNKLGYKTAILSGGFNYFGQHLQRKLGVDYVFANELEIIDGKVTGEVQGTVVDGNRKAELLEMLAGKENITLEQVIAVGDGANDLPMLSKAGLGIAFHAKPLVRESASHAISNLGLDAILYLMGLRDSDTGELG